ncbi:rCG40053, isoform CRA_c [Rattus norvegicus]|uniref:RCG40053, isoform CRA_c n=1 Tax=Rattus norvegicus TaxID=10116 RepID=A6I7Z5_RAT|nr:rCG40053, isoform CRA_c [Rattus norvegicus]
MFSILTLFWLSGFHGPCTGVRVGDPMLKGIFSSACDQALRSQPHIRFPLPLFCQYYLGRRYARTMSSCYRHAENHVSCWHNVAQK